MDRVAVSGKTRSSDSQDGFRQDINGLRAIAVIAVIVFHASGMLRGGFAGVDVFFVISGFLISGQILRLVAEGDFSFVDFYARRARRIFPTLAVVLVACLAVGWLTLLSDDFLTLGREVVAGVGFCSNILFWLESGYFDAIAETKPLLHLWSLAIEEQFYVTWPLVLVVASKRRADLLLVAIALLTVSFIYNVHVSAQQTSTDFYSPLTRAWEILGGAVLAWSGIKGAKHRLATSPAKWLYDAMSVIGILLLAIALTRLPGGPGFPGWQAVLPVSGTILVIAAGPNSLANRTVLSSRPLGWFGLISYPLYLWHWPLLSLAALAGDERRLTVRLALVALAVPLSWLCYRFLELPIRRRGWLRPVALTATAGLVAVGVAGAVVVAANGFASRLPQLSRALIAFQGETDYKVQWRQGTCFLLLPEQSYDDFTACKRAESAAKRGKGDILLWGDSHAAHLRPGLDANYGSEYRIVQRTATSCSPIIGDVANPPHCDDIDRGVLDEVGAGRFVKIILSCRWWTHDWRSIESVIASLRQRGASEIVVIGPPPNWQYRLPDYLAKYAMVRRIGQVTGIPARMTSALNKENNAKNAVIERDLKALTTRLSVSYVSLHDLLCDKEGCLTRVGDRVADVITRDEDHFSVPASVFVLSKIPL